MPTALPYPAALLGAALSLCAQAHPDPLDPKAPVPAAVHRPAITPPRPASAPEATDWRAANARVERAGGWRRYARETLPEAPR